MAQYQARLSPITSGILLLLLCLAGAVIFGIIALLIAVPLYGLTLESLISADYLNNISLLRLLQIVSTGIGTFIVPALVLARIESTKPFDYLSLNKTSPLQLYILTVIIMLCSGPILEWTVLINKQMHLPEFLKGVEEWMKAKENELAVFTEKLLQMKSVPEFLITLLMVAILPAIGEELIFRGCLQKILIRGFKNVHAAIWVTAIIFSTIHFQFYGFLPRMLLGALFGYLFYWSKNLWIPILAHFINNGFAVVMAYVFQLEGKPLNMDENTYSPSPVLYIGSAVLTGLLLVTFHRLAGRSDKQISIDE